MSDAIRVTDVSKKFMIFHEPPLTFQKALHNFIRRRENCETIWALQELRFQVKKGETVGIIGPNASGKTTLLRLIAGIYLPTSGTISAAGRVAPSLELGSGFLNEFTAVENLRLYGAVFGLTGKQVNSKIPLIGDFAGLGDFLDVPLRQFSVGMRMRLAFSLAVNVDADILLIDEMLAVGDIAFREKCFRRIAELKAGGMTMVLVSHHMDEIARLCDRVLLLEKGRLIADGCSAGVIAGYKKRSEQ
jgi:ABC-type polysaccharide/polyol phosphate transport system ATPase subunit